MSLFAEQYRPDRTGPCDPMALAGNLCRCTGYRPIRDAALSLGPAPDDRFSSASRCAARLALEPFSTSGFSRPPTVDACLALLRDDPGAKLVAGATDSASSPTCPRRRWPHLISLDAIDELREFSSTVRARQDRRGAAAERDRPPLGRRARGVPRVAGAVRLAADSQPRHARRQSRHRVADRRRRAAAARARRDRARRRTVRPPDDSAVVVLHRLPQDGHGGGRADRRPSRFRSRCRSSCASTRSRSGGSTTSARSPRPWRSTSMQHGRVRRARFAFGGVAATPLRVRRGRSRRSSVSRGTRRRSSACRRILDRTLQPMSDHRGSKEYRLEVSKSLVEKFWWEHAQ